MFCLYSDNTKYPFNQLPVLEVDGTPIAQSMAIMRYLGKEHGIIFIFSIIYYHFHKLKILFLLADVPCFLNLFLYNH
jgi:hypothetical protein